MLNVYITVQRVDTNHSEKSSFFIAQMFPYSINLPYFPCADCAIKDTTVSTSNQHTPKMAANLNVNHVYAC